MVRIHQGLGLCRVGGPPGRVRTRSLRVGRDGRRRLVATRERPALTSGGPGRGRPHGPARAGRRRGRERSFVPTWRGRPLDAAIASVVRRRACSTARYSCSVAWASRARAAEMALARGRLSVALPPRAAHGGGRRRPSVVRGSARTSSSRMQGGGGLRRAGRRAACWRSPAGGHQARATGATVWRGQAAGPPSASTLPRGRGTADSTGAGDASTRDSWRPGWPPTGGSRRGAWGPSGVPVCRPQLASPRRARLG